MGNLKAWLAGDYRDLFCGHGSRVWVFINGLFGG